jgi:integrase
LVQTREAADRWLAGPVEDLRETTRSNYRGAVEHHLRPRFATRRLDAIEPDDVAALCRELRAEGKSEATIAVVLGVTNRIYRYAARRLAWSGQNPVALLLPSERPKLAQARRRSIFEAEALERTIAAAHEPFRTLFTLKALTGARISELLALTWADVIADPADPVIELRWQVSRKGERRPLKTDGSARVVPIARGLVPIIKRHFMRATDKGRDAYVFATRTGRPLGQRNCARELRGAQRRATVPGTAATYCAACRREHGEPTYPVLHQGGKVPRGAVPSLHSFRHTLASRALLAGESVDELAFLLGHKDANVTRAVYVHEVADARRRAMRRERMEAEFGSLLRGSDAEGTAATIRPA